MTSHTSQRIVHLGPRQWRVDTWDPTVSAWRDGRVHPCRDDARAAMAYTRDLDTREAARRKDA